MRRVQLNKPNNTRKSKSIFKNNQRYISITGFLHFSRIYQHKMGFLGVVKFFLPSLTWFLLFICFPCQDFPILWKFPRVAQFFAIFPKLISTFTGSRVKSYSFNEKGFAWDATDSNSWVLLGYFTEFWEGGGGKRTAVRVLPYGLDGAGTFLICCWSCRPMARRPRPRGQLCKRDANEATATATAKATAEATAAPRFWSCAVSDRVRSGARPWKPGTQKKKRKWKKNGQYPARVEPAKKYELGGGFAGVSAWNSVKPSNVTRLLKDHKETRKTKL